MLGAAVPYGMEKWQPSGMQQLSLAAELEQLAATDPEHPLLGTSTYQRWKGHIDKRMDEAEEGEQDPGGAGPAAAGPPSHLPSCTNAMWVQCT